MECTFIICNGTNNNPIAVCSSIKEIKRKLHFTHKPAVTSGYTGNYIDTVEQWWIDVGQYKYTIKKIENWDN